MNNKIILNAKKPRLKMSKVEKKLNFFILFVFIFLMILCMICSIFNHFQYIHHIHFYNNYILNSDSPQIESFISFFTYFLLLNTLIPISLVVSTEIIKMIQGIFINWDILLYSKEKHCFCSVKSVSIIEELGNVNFIFSDKTGTLTKNQLEFKYCIIEKKYYEYVKSLGNGKQPTFLNFLDPKNKKSRHSFSNIIECNNLNSSKSVLINKLNFNNNNNNTNNTFDNENNISNNNFFFNNNNNLLNISKRKSSNINLSAIENRFRSHKFNKINIDSLFEGNKSKSYKKNKTKYDNSNNSIGSHNSIDSQRFSSIYSQINALKIKKKRNKT